LIGLSHVAFGFLTASEQNPRCIGHGTEVGANVDGVGDEQQCDDQVE
jgi:hypothetical protein